MKTSFILPLLLLAASGYGTFALAQSPGTFTSAGDMTTPRQGHTATLLFNGKVLIAGGADRGGASSGTLTSEVASAELYDPSTGTSIPTGSMTQPIIPQTATLLADGRVLITGLRNDIRPYVATAELYDPSTGTFTATVGLMHTGRAVLLANGNVLIVGSGGSQLFDPATDTFSSAGVSAGIFSLVEAITLLPDGRVLITGCDTQAGCFPTAAIYDPRVETFSLTGPVNNGSEDHYIATLLLNGNVLFVGHLDSNYVPAEWVTYDVATGTFQPLCATTRGPSEGAGMPRGGATATLLPAGEVLITGGFLPGGNGDTSAELYSPAKGTFIGLGHMTTGRLQHTATLLPDGTVLIAGGQHVWPPYLHVNDGVTSSVEIYRPPVPRAGPALLSLSEDGHGQGVIFHATTHHLVSSSNPAVAGETLEIYLIGLTDGSVIPPQVAVGGRMAEVLYFGKAPGSAGLNQVNIRVPIGVVAGPAVSVRLTYLARPSNEVTIGVR